MKLDVTFLGHSKVTAFTTALGAVSRPHWRCCLIHQLFSLVTSRPLYTQLVFDFPFFCPFFGQGAITGVVRSPCPPPPPKFLHVFLLRRGFCIPIARRPSLSFANSRSRASPYFCARKNPHIRARVGTIYIVLIWRVRTRVTDVSGDEIHPPPHHTGRLVALDCSPDRRHCCFFFLQNPSLSHA